MKKIVLIFLFLFTSTKSHAELVTWKLIDFKFDDGGMASGTFKYDTETKRVQDIDVITSRGNKLHGRHFIATAGSWGYSSGTGIVAFTNTNSTSDYTNAGLLRIDFRGIDRTIDNNIRLEQSNRVGMESYCTNSDCSSAANERTAPNKSRNTISGHILSIKVEPSAPISKTEFYQDRYYAEYNVKTLPKDYVKSFFQEIHLACKTRNKDKFLALYVEKLQKRFVHDISKRNYDLDEYMNIKCPQLDEFRAQNRVESDKNEYGYLSRRETIKSKLKTSICKVTISKFKKCKPFFPAKIEDGELKIDDL